MHALFGFLARRFCPGGFGLALLLGHIPFRLGLVLLGSTLPPQRLVAGYRPDRLFGSTLQVLDDTLSARFRSGVFAFTHSCS
jgi:hypothetical protein